MRNGRGQKANIYIPPAFYFLRSEIIATPWQKRQKRKGFFFFWSKVLCGSNSNSSNVRANKSLESDKKKFSETAAASNIKAPCVKVLYFDDAAEKEDHKAPWLLHWSPKDKQQTRGLFSSFLPPLKGGLYGPPCTFPSVILRVFFVPKELKIMQGERREREKSDPFV